MFTIRIVYVPMHILVAAVASVAAASGTSPLKLETRMSKSRYEVGEPIEVAVRLVNGTSRQVVVSKASSFYHPLARLTMLAYDSSGKLMNFQPQVTQSTVSHSIPCQAFAAVPVGSEIDLTHDKWSKVWAIRPPVDKREYGKLPLAPLAPGKYRLTYEYSFQRRPVSRSNAGHGAQIAPQLLDGTYTFEAGAEALYDRAFTGDLKASAEFSVGAAKP